MTSLQNCILCAWEKCVDLGESPPLRYVVCVVSHVLLIDNKLINSSDHNSSDHSALPLCLPNTSSASSPTPYVTNSICSANLEPRTRHGVGARSWCA